MKYGSNFPEFFHCSCVGDERMDRFENLSGVYFTSFVRISSRGSHFQAKIHFQLYETFEMFGDVTLKVIQVLPNDCKRNSEEHKTQSEIQITSVSVHHLAL